MSVLPQENLKIEGSEPSYDLNDKINLSCKSGDGRPYPRLNWFINDNIVRIGQKIYTFIVVLYLLSIFLEFNAKSKFNLKDQSY